MITGSGRFVYAVYKTYDRLVERLDDMISEEEISRCEVEIEKIVDHKGRLKFWAITVE